MSTELIAQAKAGDQDAFRELVEPYRAELHVHCYRISARSRTPRTRCRRRCSRPGEGSAGSRRASVRTWLYSVATNRALNVLRAASGDLRWTCRRTSPSRAHAAHRALWLEPYPDVLFENELAVAPGPEARYEAKEAISLAFVTALQLLPRGSARVILRDVLGFRAAEVADMLESTEESVTSAPQARRATLESRRTEVDAPPLPDSPAERELVGRLAAAFEENDVDGIVALLADDVRLTMPPLPLEYIGPKEARRFYAIVAARPGPSLGPDQANGQPALAFYSRDPSGEVFRATSLMVVTLAGSRIAALASTPTSCGAGLPRILPEFLPTGRRRRHDEHPTGAVGPRAAGSTRVLRGRVRRVRGSSGRRGRRHRRAARDRRCDLLDRPDVLGDEAPRPHRDRWCHRSDAPRRRRSGRVQRRAVAAGATETSPVAHEHGWRVGRVTDPFGHEWEIGTPVAAWPPP